MASSSLAGCATPNYEKYRDPKAALPAAQTLRTSDPVEIERRFGVLAQIADGEYLADTPKFTFMWRGRWEVLGSVLRAQTYFCFKDPLFCSPRQNSLVYYDPEFKGGSLMWADIDAAWLKNYYEWMKPAFRLADGSVEQNIEPPYPSLEFKRNPAGGVLGGSVHLIGRGPAPMVRVTNEVLMAKVHEFRQREEEAKLAKQQSSGSTAAAIGSFLSDASIVMKGAADGYAQSVSQTNTAPGNSYGPARSAGPQQGRAPVPANTSEPVAQPVNADSKVPAGGAATRPLRFFMGIAMVPGPKATENGYCWSEVLEVSAPADWGAGRNGRTESSEARAEARRIMESHYAGFKAACARAVDGQLWKAVDHQPPTWRGWNAESAREADEAHAKLRRSRHVVFVRP